MPLPHVLLTWAVFVRQDAFKNPPPPTLRKATPNFHPFNIISWSINKCLITLHIVTSPADAPHQENLAETWLNFLHTPRCTETGLKR